MKVELIAIPLAILFIIAMFSMTYYGSGSLGEGYVSDVYGSNPEGYPYLYSWSGEPLLMYPSMLDLNGTALNPTFEIKNIDTTDNIPDNIWYTVYYNATGWFWERIGFYMYYTPDGNSSLVNAIPITSEEFLDAWNIEAVQSQSYSLTGNFNSSYGIIALVIAMLVIVGIIGFNIVGSGENSTSTKFLITGIALLSLWGVFSIIALNYLVEIPYGLGSIFYFGLTLSYCLGIFMAGTQ